VAMIEEGKDPPLAKVMAGNWNDQLPRPRRTAIVFDPSLVMTKSRFPSVLRSVATSQYGLLPLVEKFIEGD